MVEISLSGSGEGPRKATTGAYSTLPYLPISRPPLTQMRRAGLPVLPVTAVPIPAVALPRVSYVGRLPWVRWL